MEIDDTISRTGKGLVKERFSKWLWKIYGFVFGKIVKYAIIDIS